MGLKRLLVFSVIILLTGKAFGQVSDQPFVIGTVTEIHSSVLGENRVINVYTPEGYRVGDSTRYPVVYLLDGSADEDFIHVVGLFQFNNFPWIDRVPKSIVVGIANVDRKRDFTYPTKIHEDSISYPTTGKSARFITFIEQELQPYINRKYRTAPDRMLIGQSLGGLLAAEILLTKPQLFNRYIIISPSFWWDDGSLLKKTSLIYQADYTRPTHIYVGVGKEGLGPGKIPHVMEVDANLFVEKLRLSQSKSLQVLFDYLPGETHATITHQAVFNALRMLYPPK